MRTHSTTTARRGTTRGAKALLEGLRTPRTILLVAFTLAIQVPVAACAPGMLEAAEPPAPVDRDHLASVGPLLPVVREALHSWTCLADTPLDAPPATLHVAIDGSPANDGRSRERALDSLQAAVDRAGPGDVVWIHDGVYREWVTIRTSGTADAPITISAAPGACVTFEGDRRGAGSGSRDAQITFDYVRHVVLQNVAVRAARSEGILVLESHAVLLDRLHLYDNYYSGMTTIGGSGNVYRRIVAHHNMDDADGGDSDGISISSGVGHSVEQAIAFANSDDGVDTWLSVDTRLDRVLAFDNGRVEGDGNGIKAGGRNARVDTLVQRSVAFANRASGFVDNTGRGVTFERNTAFANGKAGFAVEGAELVGNVSFEHDGEDVWMGETPRREEENSWNLAVGSDVLCSLDPAEEGFLALCLEPGLPSMGALHRGEDLEAWMMRD